MEPAPPDNAPPPKPGSEKFLRSARLLLPAEYQRVFEAGRRVSGVSFTLVAAPRQRSDADITASASVVCRSASAGLVCRTASARLVEHSVPARLGLAIAKKQLKLAHDRNRIKRLTRESFRKRQFLLSGDLKGWDIIAMIKSNAKDKSNTELANELDQLFKRVLSEPYRPTSRAPHHSSGSDRRAKPVQPAPAKSHQLTADSAPDLPQ